MKNNNHESMSVNSSAIRTVAYFPGDRKLIITFNNFNDYTYYDVPYHIYEGFRTAESKGKFVRSYVIGKFEFKKTFEWKP